MLPYVKSIARIRAVCAAVSSQRWSRRSFSRVSNSARSAALDSIREGAGTPLVSEEDQTEDGPQEGGEGGGAGAPPDDAEPSKPSIQQ